MQPDNNVSNPQVQVSAPAIVQAQVPMSNNSTPQASGQVVYATFWQRFCAILVDAIVLGIVGGVVNVVVKIVSVAASGGDSSSFAASIIVSLGSIFISLIQLVYAIYFIGSKGQTLGKMALKIKVVKIDTNEVPGYMKAFLREAVGKFVSSIVFGLGYFWPLWDSKKQAWHDKMAGTVVVKV